MSESGRSHQVDFTVDRANLYREESITDLKGRDPNELNDSNIPASLLPRGEEIFFAAGRTPTPGEDLPRVRIAEDRRPSPGILFANGSGEVGIDDLLEPGIDRQLDGGPDLGG